MLRYAPTFCILLVPLFAAGCQTTVNLTEASASNANTEASSDTASSAFTTNPTTTDEPNTTSKPDSTSVNPDTTSQTGTTEETRPMPPGAIGVLSADAGVRDDDAQQGVPSRPLAWASPELLQT